MRRALLACLGILLGLAAVAILWYGPDLYLFSHSWFSIAFTRTVGAAVIVEGVLAALGAALCLGRALSPLASAGGGPVLPIWGVLFLLAALGPYEQAQFDADAVEVMDSMPGYWGPDIVEADHRHLRTERTFCILWLVVGGVLLLTPLFLKPRLWHLGWRISGVGCGIALGGFLLSGMGAFVCFVNGMLMEGAMKDVAHAGFVTILAGAIVAVIGSIIAVLGKAKPLKRR